MAVDLEALFKKDAFASLDPERKRLFRQFAGDIDGKSPPEIAAMFMKLNQSISKSKPVSAEERRAMINAIYDSLPESDKSKFNNMLRMLNQK